MHEFNHQLRRSFSERIGRVVGRSARRSVVARTLTIAFALAPVVAAAPALHAQSHILVQESEYGEWQARAAVPGLWANLRADAIIAANSLTYDPTTAGFGVKNYLLRDVAASNALAYILDPARRGVYRQNLRNNLLAGLQDITSTHNSNAWEYNVPQGSMVFDAILALDVVRYDPELSGADRAAIESLLSTAVNQIVTSPWQPNGQTVRSLWALYQGNASSFASWRSAHDAELLDMFTPGGVVIAGPNYAAARLSDTQAQAKSLYGDVLERRGEHAYYSNPELRAGHEFMYGYSHSPFGRGLTFGDAVSYSTLYEFDAAGYVENPQILRADRFSESAGRYAAWQLKQGMGFRPGPINATGRLITYATMTGPITTNAELAPSRVFDAYAGLIETRQSPDALYAGMLSLTEAEAHSHKEVNAVALGAFGEHVLRNAGYNGYGAGVGMASWNWINNTAESGNTVVINGVNHVSKVGGGVTQGIVGTALEFARADSGSALSNGKHLRDLMFVQPGDGVGGYWIVADHVTPSVAGQLVQAFWHPNAATLTTQTPHMSFVSDVTTGPRNFGSNQVKLTTFLATPPQSTQIKRTTLADRSYSFDADYLTASYGTSTGSADMLTVFFPSDQSHAVATMARASYGLYTGATVTQGDVVDFSLASNGKGNGLAGGASFRGQDVVFRTVDDEVAWYFVGAGRSFDDGAAPRMGFQAASDVSLFLDDQTGRIISPGTTVTLFEPGLTGMLLDEQVVVPSAYGLGWLTAFIPAGEFGVRLLTAGDSADFITDGTIDGSDFLAWQRGAGATAGASHSMGDANYDGDVDADDLAVWTAAFGGLQTATLVPEPEPRTLCAAALAGVMAAFSAPGLRRRAAHA